MMNEMLRNRWEFEGFIFLDWGATYSPYAMVEGLDVEMGGGSFFNEIILKSEILTGHISIDFLDNSVRRLLYSLEKFDMLGKDKLRDPRGKMISPQTREDHGKTAPFLSERAAVLLKNEGNPT